MPGPAARIPAVETEEETAVGSVFYPQIPRSSGCLCLIQLICLNPPPDLPDPSDPSDPSDDPPDLPDSFLSADAAD
jgi:hypothetical protein